MALDGLGDFDDGGEILVCQRLHAAWLIRQERVVAQHAAPEVVCVDGIGGKAVRR